MDITQVTVIPDANLVIAGVSRIPSRQVVRNVQRGTLLGSEKPSVGHVDQAPLPERAPNDVPSAQPDRYRTKGRTSV